MLPMNFDWIIPHLPQDFFVAFLALSTASSQNNIYSALTIMSGSRYSHQTHDM
jgi:hypothetical protein